MGLIGSAGQTHRQATGRTSSVTVMKAPLRTAGSALTVGMVALLGVSSLSPADAAGINQQALRPVSTALASPSALPGDAGRFVRVVVDDQGRAHLS